MTRLAPALALILLGPVIVVPPAGAQIPDAYTNLEVLPRDISKADLVNRMREVAGSLGVRCHHCHVGPENLQGMDFATDEKPAKRTARVMMKMVEEINAKLLKPIETGRAETTKVRCVTCHRGVTVPEYIDEIVTRAIETKGVDAALAEYRELREKYYGSAAYDFSQGPLNVIVERLAGQKKVDDAFTVARTNVELHPNDAYPQVLLARLHLLRGERDPAVAALRKAVEIDPANAWVKKQLDELVASPDPLQDKD
jgi:hypothetical protein